MTTSSRRLLPPMPTDALIALAISITDPPLQDLLTLFIRGLALLRFAVLFHLLVLLVVFLTVVALTHCLFSFADLWNDPESSNAESVSGGRHPRSKGDQHTTR